MIASIALDLGSTSIKAGLLSHDGVLSYVQSSPAPALSGRDGRCESDALAYAAAAEQVLAQCLAQTNERPSLGLCSQRSSFLIWDRASGEALTPLISWQDTRGACETLREKEGVIHEFSGLRLTPYYFGPKLRVVLQENPTWRERLECGEYLVGTLDTFLIWRWTGGKQFVTDASMAARTLLMDVSHQCWSPALCKIFDIPLNYLAQIIPSVGANIKLDNGLTLQASMGDQSAAFFASVGADDKAALINLGTGGFVMRGMAQQQSGLDAYLRTLLYQHSDLHERIAIEGTLNSIASALADFPVADCRVEDLAKTDILCLAEPSGLGAPYFRKDFGIHFSHTVTHLSPEQIGALLLEGIIFRVARIVEEFHHASALDRVYLSGGLSALACLQQGIAQCLTMDVYLVAQKETSLQGAALLVAGMVASGEVERVKVDASSSALAKKYQRWKMWLDELLVNKPKQS
ncbi:MAG: FGGY family carbohydrate kinase [Gallionellaceae bacterium]